ncbi:MAG: hypothetical protein IIX43_09320 [Bacteroidales bacterium]|nr:hypothetical protein [Bacteroidales bacterium]
MKRILTLVVALVLSAGLYAQKDVTKFLGIPVDGTKQAMIQKLKAKGFTYNQQKDVLKGEFNGEQVEISVQTKGNKVWRLAVSDVKARDEGQIKIRFNNLVRQFEKNDKYIPLKDSQTISDEEDISYGISIKEKQYEASFSQFSKDYFQNIDTLALQNLLKEEYARELKQIEEYYNRFTEEQWENPTEAMSESLKKIEEWRSEAIVEFTFGLLYKKLVWFTIGEDYGRYKIVMFYENGFNEADGSDL